MRSHVWRIIAALIVLGITIATFIYFFVTNAAIRQQLSHTSLATIAILLVLYIGTIGALVLVTLATLRLCGITISWKDNILLNAYTTVINFFGPLQSGPAFRAVYLKKTYKLSLKKFAAATLLYYFFFALISGLFLLSGLLKWWLVPIIAVTVIVLVYMQKLPVIAKRFQLIDLSQWYYLLIATFLQLSLVACIYYVELHTLSNKITFSQAIIYAGAANFALFVSITPGAIGFREAFLVFTKHLHHISGGLIISANILDRAMYLVLLVVLGVFIFATHAQKQLKKTDGNAPEATANFQA